ncbi:uncharacterized protein LOC116168733 isoform X2 [Photinus pyralis]|uniref:uncharacterized protein LOC116168733 isoform X2 n=1 Tax=Photinus pyralis TaxID=7054 RepID=UPI0012676893|nr:uncharacterized protein LOC116168733 isoform X2 [Photinus pyralis]
MNVYFNAAILILQLVLLLSLVSSVPRRLQKKNKGGNTRFIGKRQLIAMEALQSGPGVFHKKLKTHVQPLEESCQSASFKNEFNSIRQQVKCEPRDTVVDLVPPLGAIIIPNAVIVKRCGGMCNGFKGCLPLQTQEKKMYVKTVRNSEILCTSITVVEDLKCRCNCLQTPKDCTPFQVYSKETCSCNCQNKVSSGPKAISFVNYNFFRRITPRVSIVKTKTYFGTKVRAPVFANKTKRARQGHDGKKASADVLRSDRNRRRQQYYSVNIYGFNTDLSEISKM